MIGVILSLLATGFSLLLLGAILPLLIRREDTPVRTASLTATLLGSALLAGAALPVLLDATTVSATLWQMLPGIEFTIVLDRLSALFLLILGVVGIADAVYSFGYVEHCNHPIRRNLLVSLMNLFILSMGMVILAGTTVQFLVFWEMMAIASLFLVLYDVEDESVGRAGLFYAVMSQFSTVFLFIGFILLYGETGTFALVPAAPLASPAAITAFLCLFIGFSVKAGIVPFHKWLPYAHPASPSNISALMSGVMLKVAVYGLVRSVLDIFTLDFAIGAVILLFGTASAILGIIYAYKETDIKCLLANHSIENIGIIFSGIGLAVIFTDLGMPALSTLSLLAALFHSFNHALFKSLLFMTAGSVVAATHTRNVEEMGGLVHRMPLTAGLFCIGAVAIAAFPPLNGFVSELMLFESFFFGLQAVDPLAKVLLISTLSLLSLTGALTAACFVKVFGIAFLAHPRSASAADAEEQCRPMLLGPAILAGLCVVAGVGSFQIFRALGYDLPLPDMLVVGTLMAATLGAVFLAAARGAPKTRVSETWGCGILSQNSRMEYTETGYAEPVVTIFSSIYRKEKKIEKTWLDPDRAIVAGARIEMSLIRFFEEYLYLPIARGALAVSSQVQRFHAGTLDTYMLYTFVIIVILVLGLGWFI
ncbi:MAG: proton-conducting transporter membrane subunit [Methanoculleus sp.]|nr:proton-conducting transporter membrane subunit [Methanoculleus sp.]